MDNINLIEHLGIKTKKVESGYCQLELEISKIHLQPYGLVHGGLNGVLIETACSLGANESLSAGYAVGIDLKVNHLSSVTAGKLIVIATPDHIGKTTQVWEAKIFDSNGAITSIGRCTLLNKTK